MDTLTFVVNLLGAIAWPIAALAIALIFRREIRALLGRITRGRLGSAEFEFDKDAQDLKDVVYQELKDKSISISIPKSGSIRPSGEPRTAVISTWTELEELTRQLAMKKNVIDPFNARNPSRVIRALEKERVLEPTFITLFHELRALRNQAAHDANFRPSPDSLSSYLEMAEILKHRLRRELSG